MTFRLLMVAVMSFAVASCASRGVGGADTSLERIPSSLTAFTTGGWDLRVDRAWDGQAGNVQFPSDTLAESAYGPVVGGPTYRVVVSAGGEHVAIGETPLQGRRTKRTASLIEYDLSKGTFAGGRFVAWLGTDGLQGELTIYGSGRPIVTSERGSVIPVP